MTVSRIARYLCGSWSSCLLRWVIFTSVSSQTLPRSATICDAVCLINWITRQDSGLTAVGSVIATADPN